MDALRNDKGYSNPANVVLPKGRIFPDYNLYRQEIFIRQLFYYPNTQNKNPLPISFLPQPG